MSARLLVFLAFVLACAGSDLVLPGDDARPAAIAIVDGDNQSGRVGTTLDDPLIVEVTDEQGEPVAGVAVAWLAGEGDVDPSSVLTGSDGRASTRRILGSTTGVQTAAAVVSGVGSVEFTAMATSGGGGGGDDDDDGGGKGKGKPSRMVAYRGNNQTALAGAAVSTPPAVVVTDAAGDPVAGSEVTFTVVEGGGGVTGATAVTNAAGVAAVGSWTLGSTGGTNKLRANVDQSGVTGNPLIFTATAAVPAVPDRLVFRIQPSNTEKDERIEPEVEVAVVNGSGDVVRGRVGQVRLELLGGSSRARLRGSASRSLEQGVATFDNIRVDREGRGYRLRVSLDGLAPIESNAFDIIDD